MKKGYLLYTALIFSVLLSGCLDLAENPKANLTPGTYFKTPAELEGTIAAMYRVLAPDDAWGFTAGFTSFFGSDDLATHPGSNKGDFRDFDRLQGNSGNSSYTNEWNAPWKCIYQANAIISAIDGVTFASEAEKNKAVGQAYFCRALSYYYLTRIFGELPIITGNIDVNDRPDRQSVSDVYALIVSDLQKAESFLPPSWSGQAGKATVWAAKSLLADVYLTMAGYPLNQTDKYALAAAKANDVIKSGQYTLVARYGDVFKTNNNSEAVFALQYNTAGGLPRRSTGQFCVPDDETSIKGQNGWHDYCAEVSFFKNAPKCERTEDTFVTVLKRRNSDNKTFTLIPWDDPKSNTQHPYYKKFRYGVAAPGTTLGDGLKETETEILEMNPSTDKTLDLIRYPMVLLNFAEATAMSGSPTSTAYDAVNLVRNRAGLPNLTPGLSQIAFRDAVVSERAYECAGEFGVRWFDIVRLQLLPKVIASRVVGTFGKDQYWENALNPTYTSGENLQTRYLAPIPLSEMLRNPTWKQNPGY